MIKATNTLREKHPFQVMKRRRKLGGKKGDKGQSSTFEVLGKMKPEEV